MKIGDRFDELFKESLEKLRGLGMSRQFRQPDEWEIQRAEERIYSERLEDLMGEALSEADDLRKRRIALAVIAQDPLEVGQLVMDVLEAYCKPSEEASYLRAVEHIEFGDSE